MRALYPSGPLTDHPPLRSEEEAMEDVVNARREEAVHLLTADCSALVLAMIAKGYLKAEARYRVGNGEFWLLVEPADGNFQFFRGKTTAYAAALAWIATLPKIPTPGELAAEMAPWFETTPHAPAGDGGGSGDADGSGAAAASSEIPRPTSTADGGGPAYSIDGRGAAAENSPVDSITRPASLADAAAFLRGLVT
jgi:hypothetical protein